MEGAFRTTGILTMNTYRPAWLSVTRSPVHRRTLPALELGSSRVDPFSDPMHHCCGAHGRPLLPGLKIKQTNNPSKSLIYKDSIIYSAFNP
jgi:hypothetical protein